MIVDYTLLTLLLGAVYGLVKFFLPDFPISLEVLLGFVVYVLLKLGVEIINRPIKTWLYRRGFLK